jgi:hypothetical protein
MRICASYLKPRLSRRASIRPVVLQDFCAFKRLPVSHPPCHHSPQSLARSFSARTVYLCPSGHRAWDTSRPPEEEAREPPGGREDWPRAQNGKETDGGKLRPPKAELQSPDAWILLLEQFLPARSTQSSVKPNSYPVRSGRSCGDILAILHGASSKNNTGIDLLAHLGLKLGRWQAALDLVNVLLQNVASKVPSEPGKVQLPGLSWPRSPSLDTLCSAPIHIDRADTITPPPPTTTTTKENTAPWDRHSLDPRYLELTSKSQDHTMAQIWKSLGYTIIGAADLEGEEADAAMRFVYRVIAQIHKLGLVPDNVYTYIPPNYTSSVMRPPIMHLLSSRLLTTLSDAVWRAHQDDVIAEAVSSGMDYKDLGHDPPGGRFRLKVRPLGPEVWLEFVLWCCADGGFASAGTKIIDHLRQRTGRPWFAVNWMLPGLHSSTASSAQSATIDWSRVQLRTGGTVGRIEGYSAEQPFAVMEPRTISTEVVLALVDSLVNSLNVGIANRGSSLAKVLSSIKSLLSFLEPHRLPSGYFEHVAVRLHQSGSCDPDRGPEGIQSLAATSRYMRSLEAAEGPVAAAVSLDLESIATHSEFVNGLFHQSLEAFVNLGDVRRALDVFAEIQQLMDSSKLRSINIFLSTRHQPSRGYFSSRTATVDDDFVLSHGQLPLYKLAAFLDLITDSRLVRLGNWLLYSEDVDGPLVPESSYGTPCIAPTLIRFAAVSQDHELVRKVMAASHDRPLLPSVTLFRALANTYAAFSQYRLVHRVLRRLRKAKAGGFRPENFASLAACFLSLEIRTMGREGSNAQQQVLEARNVMDKLLQGFYNGNPGVYRDRQRALIQQQLASILRILECIPHSSLSDLAYSWRSQLDSGNGFSLHTADFNILLAAVVETKGANIGRMIWDLFCVDPREKIDKNRAHADSYFVPGLIEDDENEWEHGHFLPKGDDVPWTMPGYRHIPVVEVDELPVSEAEDTASETLASDTGYEEADKEQAAPRSDESIGFDSKLHHATTIHPLVRMTSDLDSTNSSLALPSVINPVVEPNLRTLRFIVRGALNERRIRHALGLDTSEQQEILAWSKQFFRAFGIRGKAIQEEIQSFMDEDEQIGDARLDLAEEKRLYDETRRKVGMRERHHVDVSWKFLNGSRAGKRLPSLVRI